MVGVPGRSKACITCRNRKKGCDTLRPSCSQCIKAGLKCLGYARQRIFVHTTQQEILPNVPSEPKKTLTPRSKILGVVLPDSLLQSARIEKYASLYWEIYLPTAHSPSLSKRYDRIELGGWTATVQDLYPGCPVLKNAFLALAFGTIGRKTGEKWMSEEGVRSYVSALERMAGLLGDKRKEGSNSLLLASKLFSLYESMYGADTKDVIYQGKGWLVHCTGDLALITSRQPEDFRDGYAHRLFVDGRLALASAALVKRKRIILSSKEWKTIPWQLHPKTPKDRLIDILVDIPTLLEDLDIMKSACSPQKQGLLQELIKSCWSFDARLTKWYQSKPLPHDFHLPELSNMEYISIPDLLNTHLLAIHWTLRLILYKTLVEIVPPDIVLPERADPAIYCQNIIRTIPIFLHPSVGTFRWHLVNWPVAWVVRYLDSVGEGKMVVEKKLLEAYFEREEAGTMKRFVTRKLEEK